MSLQTQKFNSSWVRHRAAGYLRGKGLSFGVGPEHIFPDLAVAPGKFSLAYDSAHYPNLDICDETPNIIADNALDHIFVGPRVMDFKQPAEAIKNLACKLKIAGHLIIHITKDNVDPDTWVSTFAKWKKKASYVRGGQTLAIYKLLNRSSLGVEAPTPPSGRPRACIARYGAIGDMIMISPLIKKLAEDGYEVTLNITPYCAEVVKNNPHVHNIVLQEREMIPNADLGNYWNEWKDDYDKYINLSESIEGKLLKVEGRRDFFTIKSWREEQCGATNYYDQTMRLGGYPDQTGHKGELFFSNAENKACKHFRSKYKDKFFIMWALRGSSFHKQYPLLGPVLTDWLNANPEATVMLTGGPGDEIMQFPHPQVIPTAGQIPIREVFCMTQYADLVVGPESSIINAAACFDTRKTVFLSHSNEFNLCAYWTNYTALAPINVACYPCHQLHYTKPSCPMIQIKDGVTGKLAWEGPTCAGIGVTPERLKAHLDQEIALWKSRSQQLVSVL